VRVVLSSGHGKYVRGAESILDEVNEARRVVEAVADDLDRLGVDVIVFHDNESTNQDDNLAAIVDFHNAQDRDYDVSVHFNAYLPEGQTTDDAKGCEVWFATQKDLAAKVSSAMAEAAELPDRGAKSNGLYFLSNTDKPAILLEVCFVDSTTDAEHYNQHFDEICAGIATAIAGRELEEPDQPEPPDRIEWPERPDRPERPPGIPGTPPETLPSEPPPTVSAGDYGSAVRVIQEGLGVQPIDSDFGPKTENAVKAFQQSNRLTPDGVVGPQTWAAMDEAFDLPPYPTPMLPPLAQETIHEIEEAASRSDVAELLWNDRGQAPIGYIQGMALAYATVVRKFERGDGSAHEMAKADTGNEEVDALALYRSQFQALGFDNSRPGRRTLRHVFVFLVGLGMRESSGEHCCGRDQSAENVEAETCEAGLFQTSYNYHVCATDADWLLEEYRHALQQGDREPQCQLDAFERDVSCDADDWENYGSGIGAEFQELTKICPAFAVESAAVGIRNLRKHWGPIGRMEVQITREANTLFAEVDEILEIAEVA
jgi:peptidoglycan hydrolase-like protein with peptidoglycan-binding domain